MERSLVFLVITVVFIICMFLTWYFSHKAKHAERLLMLEKGLDPNELIKKKDRSSASLLKIGIVVIGLSIGIGLVEVLAWQNVIRNSNAAPMAIMGLCGGLSLMIANTINKRK